LKNKKRVDTDYLYIRIIPTSFCPFWKTIFFLNK